MTCSNLYIVHDIHDSLKIDGVNTFTVNKEDRLISINMFKIKSRKFNISKSNFEGGYHQRVNAQETARIKQLHESNGLATKT